MKIVIGCDHGALELKETVKEVLKEFPEAEVQDMGTYTAESVDYPEIAEAIEVLNKKFAGEGRVLIRPSGTEPLVRVMIEGKDQKMIEEEAKKLAELIQNIML